MRLLLLLFDILLVSASSVRFEDIHPNVYSGFKHIEAEKITKKLVLYHKDSLRSSYFRCLYFYCYGAYDYDEDKHTTLKDMSPSRVMMYGECKTHCGYLSQHTTQSIMDSWLPKLNSTAPTKDQEECCRKCDLDCIELKLHGWSNGCTEQCNGYSRRTSDNVVFLPLDVIRHQQGMAKEEYTESDEDDLEETAPSGLATRVRRDTFTGLKQPK